jgi:TonB family protein
MTHPARSIGLLALIVVCLAGPAGGQSAATLLAAAEEQFRAHRLDSAAALLRRAVDTTSGATPSERLTAWVRLGVIRFVAGDSSAAAAAFRAAFAIDTGLTVGGLDRIDPVLNAMFEQERATQIFSVSFQPPKLVSSPPLEYPPNLWHRRVTGRVVVAVIVDSLGRPDTATVRIEQSPDSGFNAAAIDFVLGSRFQPASVQGRPVRLLLRVPIDFQIDSRLGPGPDAPAPAPDAGDRIFECVRRCRDGATKPRMTTFPQLAAVSLPAADLGPSGVRAYVMVRVVVDPNGAPEPESIQVTSSSVAAYESVVTQAVAAARFLPATFEGRPVRAAVELRFEFRAEGYNSVRYSVSGP